jgi:hypothetical protein
VALGAGFIMALTTEGRVWGDDPAQPLAEVPGLANVTAIVAAAVAAVLQKDGTVWVGGQ